MYVLQQRLMPSAQDHSLEVRIDREVYSNFSQPSVEKISKSSDRDDNSVVLIWSGEQKGIHMLSS
jgi:hypothetical protein